MCDALREYLRNHKLPTSGKKDDAIHMMAHTWFQYYVHGYCGKISHTLFLSLLLFPDLSGLQPCPDLPPHPADDSPGAGTGGDCSLPQPWSLPDL